MVTERHDSDQQVVKSVGTLDNGISIDSVALLRIEKIHLTVSRGPETQRFTCLV